MFFNLNLFKYIIIYSFANIDNTEKLLYKIYNYLNLSVRFIVVFFLLKHT